MFGEYITQIAFISQSSHSRRWAGTPQEPYFSGSRGCEGNVVGLKYHSQDNMARKQQSRDSNPRLVLRLLCSFCCADCFHGNAMKLPKQQWAEKKGNQDGKCGCQLPQPSRHPSALWSLWIIQQHPPALNTHLKPLLCNTSSKWTTKPDFMCISLQDWEHQTQEAAAAKS